ncbi:hypothetical protein [Legionella fairfieldensis]|uniref:hypothetical protein n=1 Tax=Legionella fairfieldensis TaxID=45064 RepID=UPI00049003B3|nr:hypothetical protein [Legionella fairfieldensis]
MIHAKRLNKASGAFFFLGFITAQLHHLSYILFLASVGLVSSGFYFIGYLLWAFACHLLPNRSGTNKKWYNLIQFKEQHRIAALLGIAAVLCNFIALVFPVTLIAACWLFVISDCIWLIGEYHKRKHPLDYEDNYSVKQQNAYLKYAASITISSLITAIATTIAFFCPVAIPIIVVVSTLIKVYLGIITLHYRLEFALPDKPASKPSSCAESYPQMIKNLSPQPAISNRKEIIPEEHPARKKDNTILTSTNNSVPPEATHQIGEDEIILIAFR